MHHPWNEHDHPRDRRGRFGHGAGGDLGGGAHAADHRAGRGMPSIVNSTDISLSNGDDLSLDRHADGGLTVYNGHSSVTLDRNEAHDFATALSDVSLGRADEFWVSHVGDDGFSNVALVSWDNDDVVSLRLAPRPNASNDELRNAPAVHLKEKDLRRVEDANLRLDSASRIDTGNGDLDVFLNDDNQFVFRHLGEDGRPVEAKLDEPSFARLERALNVVYEGFDELERFHKGDPYGDVTRLDIPTNLGTVRVERFGEWRGDDPPADRLEIIPEHGDWGIVIDGPRQEAFDDALTNVSGVGEGLEVYNPEAGEKQDRLRS